MGGDPAAVDKRPPSTRRPCQEPHCRYAVSTWRSLFITAAVPGHWKETGWESWVWTSSNGRGATTLEGGLSITRAVATWKGGKEGHCERMEGRPVHWRNPLRRSHFFSSSRSHAMTVDRHFNSTRRIGLTDSGVRQDGDPENRCRPSPRPSGVLPPIIPPPPPTWTPRPSLPAPR